MLGEFSTDYIEKEFSKFRQGSGGTYFITVQNVVEKLNIEKAKLLLQLKVDISDYTDNEHSCQKCGYLRSEESCCIINQLPELETSLPLSTKMALFYIAGYVTRKDDVSENELLNDTSFYFQLYGDYTKTMDRGGLSIPLDCCAQWVFFCYIIFEIEKNHICRKSLCNIFMMISDIYNLNMLKKHSVTLANIFLKNHCLFISPKSTKEPALKVLKLSTKH
jgi:hypothetical protein